MTTTIPNQVRIVEVGPRDGLQAEEKSLDVATRVEFINLLSQANLPVIEVGSFVSPTWIPQLADSGTVFKQIDRKPAISYPVLVPNTQGLTDALVVGAKDIAIFAAASETFSKRNINCSIAESLQRYQEVIIEAKKHDCRVRGYLSCVWDCPYEGKTPIAQVQHLVEELLALGCYEVSLGDTIGVASPGPTKEVLKTLFTMFDSSQIAVHFHDTYGQALANCYCALELGVTTFDASVAGLGGCPYAKGASGNLATEDLLYMLEGLGVATGVDFTALQRASKFICQHLDHLPRSKAAQALQAKSG